MTRRTLLAGAAALPALADTKPVRVAVYGIGHAHAMGKVAALKALPQFELAGVCEPDASIPRTHASLHQVRWLNAREMLADSTIELIAVESRVQENVGYARQAVDAGKFVHLDKAPGTDLGAFRSLLEEAEKRKRTVQMGYQWRYHPAMQAALEAARKGWLGEVYSFRARIDKPTPAADRRALAAFRGGMMFELGCHLIDRATDLLGAPTRVTGYLWHHGKENDSLADNTLAVLEYPRATAEISVAAMHPHGNSYRTVEITGTNGSVTVRPFTPYRLTSHLRNAAGPYPAGLKETEFPADRLPGFSPDFLEMARIIREGSAPSYTAKHDLMTHEVLLRACHELT
ncbi:MAG: Gfo/Idh/MocA family oxidoreductase [Bryobacteraceae bacterium]